MGDKKILIAGFIVLGLGAARAWTGGKAATTVLEGGLLAVLLLSLLAAFGQKQAQLAANFAMLIALTAIIVELPVILKQMGAA